MLYNITCLVCVTAMLVGCVTPVVLRYSEHDTSKITIRGGACHMDTRENSTRERVYHDTSQITVMTGITVYTTIIQNICPVCTFLSTCTVYIGDRNTIG